jgi:serine/threonine-protein kinase RsbW
LHRESLTISATLEELAHVHEWTKLLLTRFGVPDAERYNILLAASEAVTNAIRHGANEDPRRHVRISVAQDDHGITIAVEDDGTGFAPEAIPDPTHGPQLYQAGGRGIYLLKALASDVEFNVSDQGTTVVCKFRNLGSRV